MMLLPLESVPLIALESTASAEAFLLARVGFGAVLAFMGLNHFLDLEAMAGYAGAKGLPAPRLAVLASGAVLVAGGLGIALGVAPVIAGALLVGFILVTTPLMHDFWAVPEEDAQAELTHFLKNVALGGAALGFLAVGFATWPYAVNVGLF